MEEITKFKVKNTEMVVVKLKAVQVLWKLPNIKEW